MVTLPLPHRIPWLPMHSYGLLVTQGYLFTAAHPIVTRWSFVSPCFLPPPGQCPTPKTFLSSLEQNRDNKAYRRECTQEPTASPASSLLACFEARHERPFQKDVGNCHQSLSSLDNSPARTKRKKYVDVLFVIRHGLQNTYNHENHSLTKTTKYLCHC